MKQAEASGFKPDKANEPTAVTSHPTPSRPAGLAAVAVLIPALQPDRELLRLLEALLHHGFGTVLLVDDGSGPESQDVFQQARTMPRVRVLCHAVNLGKGRALKTGINHFLAELPSLDALVTADADGQHQVSDIVAVGQALCAAPNDVVIGVRTFTGRVPLRSRMGNFFSRTLFTAVTGIRLADTQTGLRGFPRCLLPNLLQIAGERYEYEMAVLAHVCRRRPVPTQLGIETVYLGDNRSSHFRPLRDSILIGRSLAHLTVEALTWRRLFASAWCD